MIEGRAWPIPERCTGGEARRMMRVAGVTSRKKLIRAIRAGEPGACLAYVHACLRRVDPAATLEDARRAMGAI